MGKIAVLTNKEVFLSSSSFSFCDDESLFIAIIGVDLTPIQKKKKKV